MRAYRLAVIADIHGILPPLEAVIADLQTNPPDEVIVAGDFLGGPQPRETTARLKEMGWQFLLGNGEVNMLRMFRDNAPQEWWTHRQFDMGRWIFQALDEDLIQFLTGLPEQCVVQPTGCDPVRIIHGAPWDVYKLVYPDRDPEVLNKALEMIPEDVLIFAHTHIPAIYHRNGKIAVNPGSVSNNLNGDTRASYAMLTWDGLGWMPALHTVPYDLAEVVTIFKETGFLEASRPLSRGFLESILTGDNTQMDFILYALRRAKQAGCGGREVVPDEIWLEAEESFPWKFDL